MNLFVFAKVFNLLGPANLPKDQLWLDSNPDLIALESRTIKVEELVNYKQSVSGSDSLETRIPILNIRSRGTSLRSVSMLYFNEVYASLDSAVISRTSRIFLFLFALH